MESEPPNTITTELNPHNEPPKRTLLDKWRNYTKGLSSPDTYIDFGLYYLVSTALQRRVWVGAAHKPLFLNLYIILVGKPGIGKGIILDEISKILRYYKYEMETLNKEKPKTPEQKYKSAVEVYNKAMMNLGKVDQIEPGSSKEKPLLIPVAADATTYEALIKAINKAKRFRKYVDEEGNNQIYTYSAICFCLEELSSLFRKHAEDVGKFLLNAYDCKDYEYDTKTKGNDILKRPCVALLAGTTPDFIEESYSNRTMEQGLSSRMWFIFEPKNRFNKLFPDPLDDSQKEDYMDILAHVKVLSELYGHAKFTPEAEKFLKDWWEDPKRKVSSNIKLEHYESRKQIHMMKLAAAIHFMDSTSMDIPVEPCIKAKQGLERIEVNMHMALTFDKTNPLAKVSEKIVKYLKNNGEKIFNELYMEFWNEINELQLKEIMNALIAFGKIEVISENKTESTYKYVIPPEK